MSQPEMEDMIFCTWETCQKELPEALPKLISIFLSSNSWSEKIRLFNIVTTRFLPHVSLVKMEQSVFSQLLPKVVKEFDSLLFGISNLTSEFSSQNADPKTSLRNVLENMGYWLEALSACVNYFCSTEEPVALENIQSLPTSVLEILIAAFTHCKESDTIYRGRLHLVSDLLQTFFKDAVFLQKQLMELLDKTIIRCSSSEKDPGIVSLLHTFLDICTSVSKMDHALHANTWKFIIKQSIKHQALIENQMRHHDIVSGLCDDILLSFKSCMQLAEHMKLTGIQENLDQRLFQKTLKLSRFFATSLLHYIKEFTKYLSGSCTYVHHLYLQIYSQFPPSPYAVCITDFHKCEIATVFLEVLDHLINQLLPFKPFAAYVLNESLELPQAQLFPQCFLILSIVDKLSTLPEDVQFLWCCGSIPPEQKTRISVFKAVFQRFAACSPEISLPIIIEENFMKRQITMNIAFYEYTYIHLCAYITSMPLKCFSELEFSLLNAVISHRMIESLLATDVWCFLARYGTADLCAQHVGVIANLVKSRPGNTVQFSQLIVLMRRLLFLMDTVHQASFIQMFSPEQAENVSFWQHIPISCLASTLGLQVKDILIKTAFLQCKKCLEFKCTLQDTQQLNMSLSVLLTACHFSGVLVDKEQELDMAAIIVQLVPILHPDQLLAGEPFLQETFCVFLELFLYARILEPVTLIQIVSLISSVCQEDSPPHIKLAVLEFLSLLGKFLIPQDVQISILPKIARFFAMLLSDRVWLVNQHALEIFKQVAEETSYEEIVPQSLILEETKNQVISFLNQDITLIESDDKRQERMDEERRVLENFFATFLDKHAKDSLDISKKRPQQNRLFSDDEYDKHIQSLEQSLIAVQSLLRESPMPAWLPEKVDVLQSVLSRLQQCCQKKSSELMKSLHPFTS